MATPIPPMIKVTRIVPLTGRVDAGDREPHGDTATMDPITPSTYRKAASENTVPRRTIATSRHTQTRATWTGTIPGS